MRLLVTGASGLLGLHLACAAAQQHQVTGVVHSHPLPGAPFDTIQADLTTLEAVERLIDKVQPDVLVHAAALAFPEICEEQPERSELLNAWLPGWVAQAAHRANIKLVHFSTDAIFDGMRGNYREEDAPNPRNTYARHKLAGERAVAKLYPQALILRGVFYGWSLSGQRSLAEWFLNNLSARISVRGFTDAFFCPLEAGDMAGLLLKMLEKDLSGTYHLVSPEAISKYDFGVRIARLFSLDESLIQPSRLVDGNLRASRSANLTLCCDKLVRDLGVRPPLQAASLEKFHRQYLEGIREKIEEYQVSGEK